MSFGRSWRFANALKSYDKDDEDKFRSSVAAALQSVAASLTGGSGILEIDSNGAVVATGVNALNFVGGSVVVTQSTPTVVVAVTGNSIGALVNKTTGSTTDVSIGTVTLKANTLTTGRALRIVATGQWAGASVNNNINIKFGGFVIATVNGTATQRYFKVEVYLGAATSNNEQGRATYMLDTAAGTAFVEVDAQTSANVSLTADVTIDFRGKGNSGTTVIDVATVELI